MAREPMVWWTLAAAFAFMFVLVLAANLLGDAVRDALDPRVRVGALAAVGGAK
jgi:peptide/nickel transport system permease protein